MKSKSLKPETSFTSAALVVAVASVFWGLWWWPLRWVEGGGLGPLSTNFWLYAAAALACAPLVWRRRRAVAAAGASLPAAALLFGAAILSWNLALLEGEVVRVTLLFYLAPVWGTVLGWWVLGEPIGPRRLIALPLGLIGAAVLLGGDGFPMPHGAGDWLGLGSGFLFAVSATVARRARVDGVAYTGLAFVASAVMALGLALGFEGGIAAPSFAMGGLIAAVSLIWLVPTTFGLLWGSSKIDPGRLGLLMLLEVLAAAVSASFLTDEVFGLREGIGCALILGAGLLETVGVRKPVPLS
jgi:drug/metabolite transporter (DMT)-like permease